MLVISSREFREKQALYLNHADEGEEIILQRGRNKSYKIVPVTNDDTLMSKEAFFAKIDKALEEAQQGLGVEINNKKELHTYLNSL